MRAPPRVNFKLLFNEERFLSFSWRETRFQSYFADTPTTTLNSHRGVYIAVVHRCRRLRGKSCLPSRCAFHAGRGRQGATAGPTCFSPSQLNLPVPRLVLLVLRGLALGCEDEPALGAVLAAFLVPEAPSLCLGAAAAPPAALEVAGRAELGSFLA